MTKGKVPAFLGSSFAFLVAMLQWRLLWKTALPTHRCSTYACGGVFCAGLLYLVLAGLIKVFGAKRVMRFSRL